MESAPRKMRNLGRGNRPRRDFSWRSNGQGVNERGVKSEEKVEGSGPRRRSEERRRSRAQFTGRGKKERGKRRETA